MKITKHSRTSSALNALHAWMLGAAASTAVAAAKTQQAHLSAQTDRAFSLARAAEDAALIASIKAAEAYATYHDAVLELSEGFTKEHT